MIKNRSLEERKVALNMCSKDGENYQYIAKELEVPLDKELIDLISECHKQHKKRFGYR